MTLSLEEYPPILPPLGIAYLAAVLEQEGIDVKIIDALVLGQKSSSRCSGEKIHFGMGWKEIEEEISKYRPDVVGISCLFSLQSKNSHKIAEIAKKVDEDTVVVAGGAHPSSVPIDVLQDINIDFCVIGEGELTTLELVKRLEISNDFSDIKGIGYKDKGKTIINPPRPLIAKLDELPLPARHLLPMERYFESRRLHSTIVKHHRCTSVISSRGCPGKCTFCSIHTIWGNKRRARDPKRVVDEIELLVEEYEVKEIYFEDDNLTLNKKRMENICDEIINRDLDICWTTPNGVAINTLDKELLTKMKDSGCYRLQFGIEHGDSEFRNNIIRKPINSDWVKKVVTECKELGIWTHGFFIVGLPGETDMTVKKTVEFAKELDLDTADFFMATPYPGTTLYKNCVESGYISKNIDWSGLTPNNPIIKTEMFTPEDVKRWKEMGYREFVKYRLNKETKPISIIRRLYHIRSFDDMRLTWKFVHGARKLSQGTKIICIA